MALFAVLPCVATTAAASNLVPWAAQFPPATPPELAGLPCREVHAAGETALHRGALAEALAAFALGSSRCPGDGASLTGFAVALASVGGSSEECQEAVQALEEALATAQIAAALQSGQDPALEEAIIAELNARRQSCQGSSLAKSSAITTSSLLAPRLPDKHLNDISNFCTNEGALAVKPSELEKQRGLWRPSTLRTIVTLMHICGVVVLEGLVSTELLGTALSTWRRRADQPLDNNSALDAERRGRGRQESRLPLEHPFTAPGLADEPLLLGMVRLLVGERAELDTFSIIESSPGSAAQPWHCDAPVPDLRQPLPLVGVVAVAPMVDVNQENGATEFLLGSHVNMGDDRYWVGEEDGDGANKKSARVTLTARPGSVALLDLRLRHRGGANRASGVRSVLYMSYVQDWFRDATNFKERQTREWDKLANPQRKLFARLDQRRYLQQLEGLVGQTAGDVRSVGQYRPGELEL